MGYVCHSGGCPGADMAWEVAGEEYVVVTHAYSFSGHTQYGKHPVILTDVELAEGLVRVNVASTVLNRNITYIPSYVKKLLCRNWFQVKNANTIYAIGTFQNETKTLVSGGTGWAVQMAVDLDKPIFVYDQLSRTWHKYDYELNQFVADVIPTLTEQFAGIGTREISADGQQAILDVYNKTFKVRGYYGSQEN